VRFTSSKHEHCIYTSKRHFSLPRGNVDLTLERVGTKMSECRSFEPYTALIFRYVCMAGSGQRDGYSDGRLDCGEGPWSVQIVMISNCARRVREMEGAALGACLVNKHTWAWLRYRTLKATTEHKCASNFRMLTLSIPVISCL
jgi:hypothetical protein